jgi:hypothetical protein
MSLAAVALGVVALGATACKDDAADASDPTAAPTTPGASPSSAAPAPSATASPSAHALPKWPTKKPKVTGNQVIMIDPDGKRYTRKEMIQMAAGMSAVNGNGLPSDFCTKSYVQGVKGGGTFPAGKAAFMEACQEGVRLAKQYRPN